jgi:hypothetical protein
MRLLIWHSGCCIIINLHPDYVIFSLPEGYLTGKIDENMTFESVDKIIYNAGLKNSLVLALNIHHYDPSYIELNF